MGHKLGQSTAKKTTRLDLARGLLRMHNIRIRNLAKQIGVHETTISHILSGRKKSRRIQKAIADVLDISFEELWGQQGDK